MVHRHYSVHDKIIEKKRNSSITNEHAVILPDPMPAFGGQFRMPPHQPKPVDLTTDSGLSQKELHIVHADASQE